MLDTGYKPPTGRWEPDQCSHATLQLKRECIIFIMESMTDIITKKDVEYVARLSRLKLKEEEKEKFTYQLNTILEYMEKLNELDTSKIEPTSHVVPLRNVRRKDERRPSYPVVEVLKNAPEKEKDYFKVPPIIE